VINVQAREITDELTSLVSQIDALVSPATPAGRAGTTHSFVVFLTDDPDELESKVAKLGKTAKLKNTPLTLFDGEAGHPDYKIAKDADVTVLMWINRKISVNFAFRKGELNKESVKKVVAAAKKHLATK
jgi:hypothetical protein